MFFDFVVAVGGFFGVNLGFFFPPPGPPPPPPPFPVPQCVALHLTYGVQAKSSLEVLGAVPMRHSRLRFWSIKVHLVVQMLYKCCWLLHSAWSDVAGGSAHSVEMHAIPCLTCTAR